MTLKHTPGPWVKNSYTHGAFTITDKDGNTITSRADWGHRAGESQANAQLIAASPELLEACQVARDYLDDIEWSEGGGKLYQEIVSKLDRAILLAFGHTAVVRGE